jgi:ABC-type uncharacterized transport system involved in gliding motility auxiliary subunit
MNTIKLNDDYNIKSDILLYVKWKEKWKRFFRLEQKNKRAKEQKNKRIKEQKRKK